jgi:hypothetical protein
MAYTGTRNAKGAALALPKPPRHPLISLPGLAAALALNIGAVYAFEHFLNGISVEPRLPTLVRLVAPPAPVRAVAEPGQPPASSGTASFTNAADQPFPAARVAAGAPAPTYPDALKGTGRAGRVLVDCVFDPSGAPASCRAAAVEGGKAFADAALAWLNGPSHPIYTVPAHTGWAPHQWVVSFKPPG